MKFLILVLSIALTSCASITKKDITYKVDGVKHTGHIASGAKKAEKKPAVIIVHEWWGHNEYVKERANKLAKLGYVAMSIDMYGNGKQAKHPKDAGAFAKKASSNMSLAKKKFTEALKILKNRDDVDSTRIAAIGYCFGGGIVLNMMRMGVELDLVASFHGSLSSPLKAKRKKVKVNEVLIFNGADDPMVKGKDITNFKNEMDNARVKFEFYNYKNAKHAFTNEDATKLGKKFNLPLAYNEDADEDSWEKFTESLRAL